MKEYSIDKIKVFAEKLKREGNKEAIIKFLANVKKLMNQTKQKINYENAMQLALKLVLNGSYGAFANQYFCFFNNDLAASITSTCRDLTRLMDTETANYFYNKWHLDYEVHEHLGLTKGQVKQIPEGAPVSAYGDSITGDSIITTIYKKYTIEELYDESLELNINLNLDVNFDKEVIKCDKYSLNWTEEKGIYYAKIKNIIRHKVSKKKWKLVTKSGKSIIATNDHSMVVFRNSEKIIVKPEEILDTDNILVYDPLIYDNTILEGVESIECLGSFDDEYVYDLEMEDESHTFIANDILVHNTDSIFVGFAPAMESCNWIKDGKDPMDFIMTLDKYRMADFYVKTLEDFAAKHGVENLNDFELEKVAESVLFIEKKNYMQNIVMEDGIDYPSLTYFQAKGIETIKSSTPPFVRDKVMEAIKYLFSHPDDYNVKDLLKIVKSLKKQFEFADVSDISMMTSMNKYSEKVINDGRKETPIIYTEAIQRLDLMYEDFTKGGHKKSSNQGLDLYVEDTLEIVKGAHFSVKAVAFYNYLLNKNPEHKLKYEFIKSGSKVKYYYTKNAKMPVFAYEHGSYPIEFAPEIDYDVQFQKTMLTIINRFTKVLNMPIINKRVAVAMPLFSNL